MSQGTTRISVLNPMALSQEGAILPVGIDIELPANLVTLRLIREPDVEGEASNAR